MLLQGTHTSRSHNLNSLAGIFSKTRTLYDQLLSSSDDEATQDAAKLFLQEHLSIAAEMACDLPSNVNDLEKWAVERTSKVSEQYAAYLEERKAGKPRRFFKSKAHALHFLRAVAPTKLVDGSWLYGTLKHWQDPNFFPLIRTYLEELGDGVADMNHVVMYRKLLAKHGCDGPLSLPDEYYVQGTLQLALAYHAEEFLPEIIGYNLGYEQLPLHLLITAFELHELDIDPYYFTLHITIDNAHSGHARQAVQAVLQQFAGMGADPEFYRRVRLGYRLNELGLGSTAIIRSFNLKDELIRMLDRKGRFGRQVHSDYCKVEGRTVNEWLSEPGQMLAFMRALEARGWIKRGVDPGQSRFWHLIAGPDALMFGVFNEYEQRLIYEWIADDWLEQKAQDKISQPIFRPAKGSRRKAISDTAECPADRSKANIEPLPPTLEKRRAELERMPRPQLMRTLIGMMNPARHSTPEGLLATKLFSSHMF